MDKDDILYTSETDDDWETVIDFTKIKKDGVEITELLEALKYVKL